MTPKWIIETAAFPEDVEPLILALKDQGIEYKIPTTNFYEIDDCLSLYSVDDCVIFCGSLNTAQALRSKAKWIPGVYCDPIKYKCQYYYGHLGDYIFNSNYIFLPFGDLIRRKEFLYDTFGQDRAIFIRPDRDDKPFVGQLLYKEHFDADVARITWGNMRHEELIVVAEPRNIKREWRLVIVNGELITGSEYKAGTRVGSVAGFPEGVGQFAKKIAALYNPDPVWILDVCQTKLDEYRIMEVGSFSCAGLYKCDRSAIVKSVSAAALAEWQGYHA